MVFFPMVAIQQEERILFNPVNSILFKFFSQFQKLRQFTLCNERWLLMGFVNGRANDFSKQFHLVTYLDF